MRSEQPAREQRRKRQRMAEVSATPACSGVPASMPTPASWKTQSAISLAVTNSVPCARAIPALPAPSKVIRPSLAYQAPYSNIVPSRGPSQTIAVRAGSSPWMFSPCDCRAPMRGSTRVRVIR